MTTLESMKIIFKIAAVLIILLTVVACSKDDPSARDQKTQQLTAATWGTPTVEHADGDLSGQYVDFAIKFNKNASGDFEGTYIIANGGYAFEETSGQWTLSDDLSRIILDSGKEMTAKINEKSLHIEFTSSSSNGRAEGLSGHFVFELKAL